MKQQDVKAPEAGAAGKGHSILQSLYLYTVAWMLRKLVHWISGTGELFDNIVDVPTPGLGSGSVKCSVCVPNPREMQWAKDTSAKPLILVMEGGGFILGEPNDGERNARNLADKMGAVVVSLDYAKAPQYPYPHALLQLYTVLKFALTPEGHAQLGEDIDPTRVALMGNSAGGNLVTALTLLLSFTSGPCAKFRADLPKDFRLVSQVLLYPSLSDQPYHVRYQSATPDVQGKSLPVWMGDAMEQSYLPPAIDRKTELFAGPVLADHELLKALAPRIPPTVMLVAGMDCLKYEATKFAENLEKAGVEVKFRDYPLCVHGFSHARVGMKEFRKLDVLDCWEIIFHFTADKFGVKYGKRQ